MEGPRRRHPVARDALRPRSRAQRRRVGGRRRRHPFQSRRSRCSPVHTVVLCACVCACVWAGERGDCSECVGGHPTTCLSQQQPGFTRWGSFAEYVSLPRADRNLTPLPAEVSFAQAAAIGCRFSTGWRAVVQQGRLQAGESLAVFGCGGLGLSCVMIGHAAGAKVIAVDTSEQALQKAAEVGADVLVNASAGEDRARDAVIAATSGGADVSVDAAGFSATSESAVWCAARRGRVVQVGLPLGGRGPDIPMARVAGYELEIHGSHGCAAADFPALISMVARGKLRPEVLVEREVSLAEGAAAIEAMDRGSRPGVTLVTRF
eukprot:TRINITY_DN13386_c0_g1_i2.p1 TRINITY_DN13386_c0_g1~~TRINITY_DN13386_c0_g1_i2.p1  ORF type:complete len:320 (+),score=57.45 TRINITY_DN13386_c0_g1_i2:288-1247(+)